MKTNTIKTGNEHVDTAILQIRDHIILIDDELAGIATDIEDLEYHLEEADQNIQDLNQQKVALRYILSELAPAPKCERGKVFDQIPD